MELTRREAALQTALAVTGRGGRVAGDGGSSSARHHHSLPHSEHGPEDGHHPLDSTGSLAVFRSCFFFFEAEVLPYSGEIGRCAQGF